MAKDFTPDISKSIWTCPYCQATVQQFDLGIVIQFTSSFPHQPYYETLFNGTQCSHCARVMIWHIDSSESGFLQRQNQKLYLQHTDSGSIKAKIIYPETRSIGESPNEDIPPEIQKIYEEARAVAPHSLRAANALLRTVLEKMVIGNGGEGAKLYHKIKNLADKNVITGQWAETLQNVRILGNEAAHPGEINFDEEVDAAFTNSIFSCINAFAQQTYTRKREDAELAKKAAELKALSKK
jgi:hypothetical protein